MSVNLGAVALLGGVWVALLRKSLARPAGKAGTGGAGSRAVRVATIREEERQHIAREVHDELGQKLAIVMFQLVRLRNAVPDSEHALVLIEQATSVVEESIASVRRIAMNLRAGSPMRESPGRAIVRLAAEIREQTGIEVVVSLGETECDAATEANLFRILQEALTNVVRHSGASTALVSVHRVNRTLVLTVSDDGRGFKTGQTKGLGLLGMLERANRMGGELIVSSAPGKGTTITVKVPLTSDRRGVA
jgi:signal transduction histidine kinase